jgi:hypothetical protein
MSFAPRLLAASIAVAVFSSLLAGCSGSNPVASALPAGQQQLGQNPSVAASPLAGAAATARNAPPRKRRHPRTPETVLGSLTFAAASGPVVAGTPIKMTVTLTGSPTIQDWPTAFAVTLPSFNSGNPNSVQQIYLAPAAANSPANLSALNSCAGLTIDPPTQPFQTTLRAQAATAGAQMTQACSFSVYVVIPSPGSYPLANLGNSWVPDQQSAGQTFLWASGATPTPPLTVAAPNRHLYVVDSGSAAVQAYALGPNGTNNQPALCSITSSSTPNPLAVTVHGLAGLLFVLDRNGTVAGYIASANKPCPTAPFATWSAPANTSSIAVDANGDVVAASCGALTWFDETGTVLATSTTPPAGTCFDQVSADVWDGALYATDKDNSTYWIYNDASPGQPSLMCGPVPAAYYISGDGNDPGESGIPGPWRISAGLPGFFYTSYEDDAAPAPKWSPVGKYNLVKFCSGFVNNSFPTQVTYSQIDSIAYDRPTGWLAYGGGTIFKNTYPPTFTPSVKEVNTIGSATSYIANSNGGQLPTNTHVTSMAIGP